MEIKEFIFDREFLDKFIKYPYKLYKNDNKWIPTDITTEKKTLTQSFSLTENNHKKIMVEENGNIMARLMVYQKNQDTGYIGYFESDNDYKYVKAILDHSLQWFREKQVKKIWVPIDFDTWHRYRFMVSGFDEPRFISEPYNKEYYSDFFCRYGFKVLKTYYTKTIVDTEKAMKRLKIKYDKCLGLGYSIRKMNTNKFDYEMRKLFELSLQIFKDNFGYSPIIYDEFINLYAKLKPIIRPEYLLFGLDKYGTEVAFLFGYPTILSVSNSKFFTIKLLDYFKYLVDPYMSRTFNIKSMGVLENHRNTHLSTALIYAAHINSINHGCNKINHCLMIEGNLSTGFDTGAGVVSRKYELYEL
jgi:hypothetical protein